VRDVDGLQVGGRTAKDLAFDFGDVLLPLLLAFWVVPEFDFQYFAGHGLDIFGSVVLVYCGKD